MEQLIILLVWLAVILAVGIGAGKLRPVRTAEDWSVGGRSFRWITNYFTAHATQLSALTMLGFPGLIYLVGVPVLYAHFIAYMLGTCGFFVLFGTKIWRLGKKHKHITPTDFLTRYYGGGKWFGFFLGAVFFLALIPYIQIQVLGAGFLFEMASGGLIPGWMGALILYGMVVIYTWIGGLRSVAYTDVAQGAVLLFGLWVGTIAIIQVFGGGFINTFSMAIEKVPQLLTVSGYKGWNWPFVLSWALALGVGWAFHAHMWLRMYTARSAKDSRIWTATIFTENMIHGILLTGAMIAVAMAFPGVERADLAFMGTVEKLFPTFFFGLFLAAVASAIFSTVDSQVHALGLIVSHDFIERSGRKLKDREFIWVNRLVVLLVVLAGYILAYTYPEPLGLLSGYPASLGFILLPTVIFAVTAQKWVTKHGVILGLIVGYIVMAITSTGPLKNPYSVYFGLWGVIANTIVLIIVSLLTKTRPSEEAVKEVREAGW